MQRYNNLTECIQMCDRILRTNTYPRSDLVKSSGNHIHPSDKYNCDIFPKSINAFHPSRTIVVQNFLSEAEAHVQSFVAMFGIVEICELVKEEATSCLAVVQYKYKRSAADALLAMPYCQVRGSNLVVNLLWNGPYEHIGSITAGVAKSFRECAEKRVVCIGHLPRAVTGEEIRARCGRFGRVDSVRVQPQEQGAFAYVVFRTPFAAALANYCLRNSSTSNAALMLGYSESGSPVLLGPVRVRPLDHYSVPLSAFDVRCICTRFLDYSRTKGLFASGRPLPPHHFFRPGLPDHCVRVPAHTAKGVPLFMEVLLFEGDFLRNADDISEMAYQLCRHKYLFRFTVDFGLQKPIMSYDDGVTRPPNQQQQHFLRWNAFLILDLQICFPWNTGHHRQEPRVEPRIQGMNHIYSDIGDHSTEESAWFGVALRHSTSSLTAMGSSIPEETQHRNKVKFLVQEGMPFVRLAGSCDDINTYQLPVHVFSDVQSSLKSS